MGLVRQHIRLSNFAEPQIEEVDANALVDSGALELCIPRLIAKQLRLTKVEERKVHLADGRVEIVDYVAPVKIEAFGRSAVAGALVMGDMVLLGAIPMESMDVLIDPVRQQLIPNPENPFIPGALAMGFTYAEKGDDHA
ncbi:MULTISPECIES: clan AA aspartic protease [unclassified Sphingobium]|uniref:clan AA aspartic protease n=1 Tax=unclassified Sphingobium TaxID=2611147 RepID=UPI0035A588A6